ncbi:MAG: hypothetical protein WCP29_02200 [Acidobacteriota bacterium]
MKFFFRMLTAPVTDAAAYVSATAAAACWVVHAWYPAVLPGQVRESAPVWLTAVAALAAGMMLAKHVLLDSCARSIHEAHAETASRDAAVARLEGMLADVRQQQDRAEARESALVAKLKRTADASAEVELTTLRKRLRKEADDRISALGYLVRELKSHIGELARVDDRDIAHAAGVLAKETLLLEDEIKKGERSLYELVLATSQIQRHAYDLTAIRLETAGEQEDGGSVAPTLGEVPWFKADADPDRVDHVYRFLKVAFHPDRFGSESLKEQAKMHFQQAGKAYNHIKERLRATH